MRVSVPLRTCGRRLTTRKIRVIRLIRLRGRRAERRAPLFPVVRSFIPRWRRPASPGSSTLVLLPLLMKNFIMKRRRMNRVRGRLTRVPFIRLSSWSPNCGNRRVTVIPRRRFFKLWRLFFLFGKLRSFTFLLLVLVMMVTVSILITRRVFISSILNLFILPGKILLLLVRRSVDRELLLRLSQLLS